MATILLNKVEARNRLAPRRDPYWQRLEAGNYIGFRRMGATSEGTWLARSRDSVTKVQLQIALGDFADLPAHARFDAAAKAAREWFMHLGRGGRAKSVTVQQACANYVKHLMASGRPQSALDTEQRFARWVDSHRIAAISLQKLKPADVEAWRLDLAAAPVLPQSTRSKSVARDRRASTINRDMSSLRAALNLAVENGDATSDTAWKFKLRAFKDADRRRDVYLDLDQRRALVSKSPPDLAAFLSALSLVPLRPGAMAALVVGNFDKRLSTLTIGKDKHGQDRKITLPSTTAAFFAEQCRDKLPGAPLLSMADGAAWTRQTWKNPFKRAALAAGLPHSATAYALRHSTITDLIALHRLDTMTVAQLSGTSLLMIEKHYGHLLRDHAAKALAALTI